MHSAITVAHATELRQQGQTYAEISRATGVYWQTVKRWLPDPLSPKQQEAAGARFSLSLAQREARLRPAPVPGILWVRGRGGEWLRALVDADDWEQLHRICWRLVAKGYVSGSVGRRQQYLHRVVCGVGPGERWSNGQRIVIDHRNRDKLDNRRANLRVCTQKINCANRGGIFAKAA